MEPPNPPGPQALGRGGGLLPPLWGSPQPPQNPLGTVASLVKSPTATHGVCVCGGRRTEKPAGRRWGTPEIKGGVEIKLGLTPSEPQRYLGNTENGQKMKKERRRVQAGGLSPRTLQAGMTPDVNTLRSCVMRRKRGQTDTRTHLRARWGGGDPRGVGGTKSVAKVLMAGGRGGQRGGGETSPSPSPSPI